jgi:hypothetical protein
MKQYKNTVNTSPHITKTPTHYRTHTYTNPHITEPTHTHTHIWDGILCHQASCSWHLEGLWCLQCQRWSSLRPALGLRNCWRWLFSTSQTNCPVTQHHVTEDMNCQDVRCTNTLHKMNTCWIHCIGMSIDAHCTWCGLYIAVMCLAHLS